MSDGMRPITNGEIIIPIAFFAIGLLLFLYFWVVRRAAGKGVVILVCLFLLGTVFSKIFYFLAVATGSTTILEGPGQAIQTGEQAVEGEFPEKLSENEVSNIAQALDVQMTSVLKKNVEIKLDTERRVGKTIIKANIFVGREGKILQYEGVVGSRLKRVVCDFRSGEYASDRIASSCEYYVDKTFGKLGVSGG